MYRESKILQKIQFVEENPKLFRCPELILEGLNNLLLNLS